VHSRSEDNSVAQSRNKNPSGRIGGHTIVGELIRNMELGRLEMAYTVLLPCIFSVYLHPDDYARLSGVEDHIREDASRALTALMDEWNGQKGRFRKGAHKEFKIASGDWWIQLFPDTEGSVPPGDVEIHSELNESAQPTHRGVKTTLIGREPSVTAMTVMRDRKGTQKNASKPASSRVFAEIRYKDDSGAQTYFVTQDEISIGRGGEDLWVDLPLYASDEVSREHASLRRNPANGAFAIVDKSRNGTWLNGKRIERGVEQKLPDRAEIGIAEAVKLQFEVRR
jgi:hypothetical protein